jgi:hypothetical protein
MFVTLCPERTTEDLQLLSTLPDNEVAANVGWWQWMKAC